jgi:hypothetical protein
VESAAPMTATLSARKRTISSSFSSITALPYRTRGCQLISLSPTLGFSPN